MASGAPDREGRFVAAGQNFYGVLHGSQMFFLVPGCSWR
jgi:hypothetical protein